MERVFLGAMLLLSSFFAYYTAQNLGILNTFVGGGTVIGLVVGGIIYLIFSFETIEYLKHIEKNKKQRKLSK